MCTCLWRQTWWSTESIDKKFDNLFASISLQAFYCWEVDILTQLILSTSVQLKLEWQAIECKVFAKFYLSPCSYMLNHHPRHLGDKSSSLDSLSSITSGCLCHQLDRPLPRIRLFGFPSINHQSALEPPTIPTIYSSCFFLQLSLSPSFLSQHGASFAMRLQVFFPPVPLSTETTLVHYLPIYLLMMEAVLKVN